MNSIRIRLTGGLGNQMFQYAAARALSAKLAASLQLDLSWFSVRQDRQFALDPFNIKGTLVGGSGKGIAHNEIGIKKFVAKINYRLRWLITQEPIYKPPSFGYDPEFEMLQAPLILKGYFQSERYFKKIEEAIRDDFRLKHPPLAKAADILNLIQNSDSICVHIRRGDYISNPKASLEMDICSPGYYLRGISEAAKNLLNPSCFVFSDEPDWARNNLKFEFPTTIVDIHDVAHAHEDLRLMSACKNFVIANSTLSWWAGWLSTNPNKRIIAPGTWFRSKNKNTLDLFPDSWVVL